MLKIKQTWRGKIMGCLKSIIRKIIFLALLFAFFFFGGCDFVLTKYNEFTCPPREELLEQSKDFGDFSAVSSDYRLTRSLNIFGYRKFNSEYMPSGQKITIIDLNKKELITPEDFTSGKINAKINNALDVLKDSVITFENLASECDKNPIIDGKKHNKLAKSYEQDCDLRISPEEIERLYSEHVRADLKSIEKAMPKFYQLPPEIQNELINHIYNTGYGNFSKKGFVEIVNNPDLSIEQKRVLIAERLTRPYVSQERITRSQNRIMNKE